MLDKLWNPIEIHSYAYNCSSNLVYLTIPAFFYISTGMMRPFLNGHVSLMGGHQANHTQINKMSWTHTKADENKPQWWITTGLWMVNKRLLVINTVIGYRTLDPASVMVPKTFNFFYARGGFLSHQWNVTEKENTNQESTLWWNKDEASTATLTQEYWSKW